MINNYNTIIWDWNGTLLDDAWLGVAIMDNMLKSRNLAGLSLEKYREIFDFPVKDYYSKLGLDFSVEPFEKLGNEFIERYDSLRFECKLRNSARELLEKFNTLGKRQFILSARNHKQLDEEIEFHGIQHYFEHFSGLNDNYANGKLEMGLKFIELQGIDTNKAVLIGDTLHDFEVAQALGIDCVLVEGGHQSVRKLKKSDAQVVIGLEEIRNDYF
jgi:phosphoglycolate phosphatase